MLLFSKSVLNNSHHFGRFTRHETGGGFLKDSPNLLEPFQSSSAFWIFFFFLPILRHFGKLFHPWNHANDFSNFEGFAQVLKIFWKFLLDSPNCCKAQIKSFKLFVKTIYNGCNAWLLIVPAGFPDASKRTNKKKSWSCW